MRGIDWRRAVIGVGAAAIALGLSAVPSAAQHSGPTVGTQAVLAVSGRLIPPGSNMFVPPKLGNGDADFSGNGPKVVASASLEVQQKRLLVTLCMHARETKSDFTEAGGCFPSFVLFDAPAGQCIQGVDLGRYDALSYVDADHDLDEFGQQVTSSFVNHWAVMGDTTGNEAGTKTGVQIITNRIVAFTETC